MTSIWFEWKKIQIILVSLNWASNQQKVAFPFWSLYRSLPVSNPASSHTASEPTYLATSLNGMLVIATYLGFTNLVSLGHIVPKSSTERKWCVKPS